MKTRDDMKARQARHQSGGGEGRRISGGRVGGPAGAMQRLQRSVGNRAVARLVRHRSGRSASDPLEASADRQARQVMAAPHEAALPRGGRNRHGRPSPPADPPSLPRNPARLGGSGRPLPGEVRSFFEAGFGRDFHRVRIHTGPRAERSAAEEGARAYTIGNDIVFGDGQYAPSSESGRFLLAHELAHVVQQRTEISPRLQMKPRAASGEQFVDLGRGFSLIQDKKARTGVVYFNDAVWVSYQWPHEFPPTVGIQFTDYDFERGYLLSIESRGRMAVTVDRSVEKDILGSITGRKIGVGYHFVFPGEVVGLDIEGPDSSPAPPFNFAVTLGPESRIIINPETPPEPPTMVYEERLESLRLPDTFPSFDSLAKLNAHLNAHPKQNFAVLEMPDGRFVARPLNEYQLQQLAKAARESKYESRQMAYIQGIESYLGRRSRGSFFKLSIAGREVYALDDLADVYYRTMEAAERGTRGTAAECEVFRYGDYSYGRKALTHDEAVARWLELDKLSKAEVDKLETEPGHDFVSLRVRGAGKLHSLGPSYFHAREAYGRLIEELDKAPDEDAREKILMKSSAGIIEDYLFIEVDREKDAPGVAAGLKRQPELLRLMQLLIHTKVADAAQREAVESLGQAAFQIRGIVENEKNLLGYVMGFKKMKTRDRRDSLTVLGVPEDEIPAYIAVLSNPQKAFETRFGVAHGDVSIARLAEYGLENAKALESLVREIKQREFDVLQLEGDFGDNIRTIVYRQFGFKRLQPEDFPHRGLSPGLFPDPMASTRGSFTTIAEQLYAARAKELDTIGTIEKALTIAGVVVATVALILVANAAGAAVAGLFFTGEGGGLLVTAGYVATQALVAGTIVTVVETGVEAAVFQEELTLGDFAMKWLWNVGSFAAFGALGRLLQGSSKAVQFGVTGAAFFGASLAHYYAEHKKLPRGSDLYWLVYQNLMMFILLHAGGLLARPMTEQAGIWARAKRLGIKETEIGDLIADAQRFGRDLSALAVKRHQQEAELLALAEREKVLLGRQEALLAELRSAFRTRGDADMFEMLFKLELKEIAEARARIDEGRHVQALEIQAVGESQSLFEYKPAPDAAARFKGLFRDARVVEKEGGRFEVLRPGEKDPAVFIPRDSTEATLPVGTEPAPTNLNTATREALMKVPGIGETKADAIIARRKEKGVFTSVDQLAEVAGFGQATLQKVLPFVTVKPGPPKPPLAEVQGELAKFQDQLLARGERVGFSGKTMEMIRRSKLRVAQRTTEKSLEDARATLEKAEKVIDRAVKARIDPALRAFTERLGEDVVAAVGKGMFSREEIGAALYWANRYPVGRNLSVRALRGLVQAQRLGVGLRKFFGMARGMRAGEVEFTLDTASRMMEAQPPILGIRRVLTDMSAGRRKWSGGLWALEKARYGHGIENLKAFELKEEGRMYDIVLKSGLKEELKNWDGWRRDRGVDHLRTEFLQDLLLGKNKPSLFGNHRYSFRDNPNLGMTEASIKAEFRGWLREYIQREKTAGAMTAAEGRALLKAFDAADQLIEISPVRYEGSLPEPAPQQPDIPAAPSPGADEEEKAPALP